MIVSATTQRPSRHIPPSPIEIDLVPPPVPRVGPVIAEFTSATDARSFAAMKRDEGQDVLIVPAINAAYLFAVRTLAKA